MKEYGTLVLTIKPGDIITIGPDIHIELPFKQGQDGSGRIKKAKATRLLIQAPTDVSIKRIKYIDQEEEET